MKCKKENEENLKERPLKGLKEMISKNMVLFKENPKSKQMSQKKLKKFKEMRK